MGVQTNQNQRDNQSGGSKDKPHPNQRNIQRNNQQQQQRERRDSGRNDGQENKGGYRVSIKQSKIICYTYPNRLIWMMTT